MAHQIETIKIGDRQIIIYYHFEPVQVPVSLMHDLTLTADKWLATRDWVWLNQRITSMIDIYQRNDRTIIGSAATTNEELNESSLQCGFSWLKVNSSFGRRLTNLLDLSSEHTCKHFISIKIGQSTKSNIVKQIQKLKKQVVANDILRSDRRSNIGEREKNGHQDVAQMSVVAPDVLQSIAEDEDSPETPKTTPKRTILNHSKKKNNSSDFDRRPPDNSERIASVSIKQESTPEEVCPVSSLPGATVSERPQHSTKKLAQPKEDPNFLCSVRDVCSLAEMENVTFPSTIEPDKRSVQNRKRLLAERSKRKEKPTVMPQAKYDQPEYIPSTGLPVEHEEYQPGNSEHLFSQEEYTPAHTMPTISPLYEPSYTATSSSFHDKYIPPAVGSQNTGSSPPMYTPSRQKRDVQYFLNDEDDEYDPAAVGPAALAHNRTVIKSSKKRLCLNKNSKTVTDDTAHHDLHTSAGQTERFLNKKPSRTKQSNLFGEPVDDDSTIRKKHSRDSLFHK